MSDFEDLLNVLKNEPRNGDTMIAIIYERNFESMKWIKELPFLNFPSHWLVKIVPPFVGAIIRFTVKLRDHDSNAVSIYFDGYNNLGHMDGPYWEIYPAKDGDTARFILGQEEEMLQAIDEALGKE